MPAHKLTGGTEAKLRDTSMKNRIERNTFSLVSKTTPESTTAKHIILH